jgi:hypothetical protein
MSRVRKLVCTICCVIFLFFLIDPESILTKRTFNAQIIATEEERSSTIL